MRFLLFTVSLLLILSCSKEVKSNKRLSGTWIPVSLKVTDNPSGLSYAVESIGTLSFQEDGSKSTKGNYTFSIQYTYKGNTHQLEENGTYNIVADECFLTSTNSIETPSRIIYQNKTDLEYSIESPEEDRLLFVLKKN